MSTLVFFLECEPANEEAWLQQRQYVRSKLEHGLVRVWGDVQAKVKLYLLGTDLSHAQYDQFIHVLDVINRFATQSTTSFRSIFCGSG